MLKSIVSFYVFILKSLWTKTKIRYVRNNSKFIYYYFYIFDKLQIIFLKNSANIWKVIKQLKRINYKYYSIKYLLHVFLKISAHTLKNMEFNFQTKFYNIIFFLNINFEFTFSLFGS